ncbi:MAG: hypothetical protein K8T89_15515 [Planctomycetes bacterium]|nr:hypothetical protein [Planctomycetota bacterium]
MTSVGKILVFMNLLMSVATSGMIVLVFTTRTNWKNEYEKVKNVALVAEASYKTEKIAHSNDIISRNAQISSLGKQNDSLVTERNKIRDEMTAQEVLYKKERLRADQAVATLTTQSQEIIALKSEREILSKEANDQRAIVLERQRELNEQRVLATNNKIEADSQKQRAERLLSRVEELEKNNTQLANKLNSLGGSSGSGTGSTASILNPPPVAAPRDVFGTVRAVATSGLTVINIGSDSGISTGNKLFIYRVDEQNPKNSLYLGEMVVSRTEPKQAVGQFYPKPFAKPDERVPKIDDVVSTSLGSR